MDNSLVSIVMPAYNVEKYIALSIESVLKQTYSNWELIIVNDCSKDSTKDIVERYDDNRIVLINRSHNSGSAYVPREEAVHASNGMWIVNLDADDFIEEEYLIKLLGKAKKFDANIVGPQMIFVNEEGETQRVFVPDDQFNFNKYYSGREAVNFTLPEWKIGMNGALIKKDLWLKSLSQYEKSGKREIHDDENLTRILLSNADIVCCDKAQYYFRSNPTSVTRRFSISTLNWMKSNDELAAIISNRYGLESEEYTKMMIYNYYCYRAVFSEFISLKTDYTTYLTALKGLKAWHDKICWDDIEAKFPGIKTKIFKSIILSILCLAIKKRNGGFFINCIKFACQKMCSKFSSNKYYRWYITRKDREKAIREQLNSFYNEEISTKDVSYNEAVICIFDGAAQAGGLADRLKGIIGTYYISKIKGLPFKIYFKHPFPLEDFLCPNIYNWMTDKRQVSRNMLETDIVVLDNTEDSRYQIAKQQHYLEKKIKNNGRQKHVYTNASFAYDLNYSELFNELFKPSKRLQKAINKQKKMIGASYVSVSCRFLDLLGDFNETYGHGKVLSEVDRNDLLAKIDKAIEKLHFSNPNKKILINSDSITFLDKYRDCEYTYVVDGNVTHIDAKQNGYCYEKYEKTFLDFMLIANADEVYLLKSPLMHKSGYPYAASKIYGKKFEIINI